MFKLINKLLLNQIYVFKFISLCFLHFVLLFIFNLNLFFDYLYFFFKKNVLYFILVCYLKCIFLSFYSIIKYMYFNFSL